MQIILLTLYTVTRLHHTPCSRIIPASHRIHRRFSLSLSHLRPDYCLSTIWQRNPQSHFNRFSKSNDMCSCWFIFIINFYEFSHIFSLPTVRTLFIFMQPEAVNDGNVLRHWCLCVVRRVCGSRVKCESKWNAKARHDKNCKCVSFS